MTQNTLSLQSVSKHYGEFVAVGDLSVEVPKGAIYGLLGPNGAGKSTTLRMVNNISVPDEGRIRLFENLSPGREASKRIGYLPEERGLYPKMRVAELLQFFAELRGIHRKDAKKKATFWLERLGISDWASGNLQSLSKGMQQKVQFATALIHEPELLILDEPWSGLDPINAEVLQDIVLEQKAAGRTVIFSTHLMEQAEKICDSVCIVARGKRVLDGALQDVLKVEGGNRYLMRTRSQKDKTSRSRAITQKVQSFLDGSPEIRDLKRKDDPDTYEIISAKEPAELLRELLDAGFAVEMFQPSTPTLHQVFVDKVGVASGTEVDGRKLL